MVLKSASTEMQIILEQNKHTIAYLLSEKCNNKEIFRDEVGLWLLQTSSHG